MTKDAIETIIRNENLRIVPEEVVADRPAAHRPRNEIVFKDLEEKETVCKLPKAQSPCDSPVLRLCALRAKYMNDFVGGCYEERKGGVLWELRDVVYPKGYFLSSEEGETAWVYPDEFEKRFTFMWNNRSEGTLPVFKLDEEENG